MTMTVKAENAPHPSLRVVRAGPINLPTMCLHPKGRKITRDSPLHSTKGEWVPRDAY